MGEVAVPNAVVEEKGGEETTLLDKDQSEERPPSSSPPPPPPLRRLPIIAVSVCLAALCLAMLSQWQHITERLVAVGAIPSLLLFLSSPFVSSPVLSDPLVLASSNHSQSEFGFAVFVLSSLPHSSARNESAAQSAQWTAVELELNSSSSGAVADVVRVAVGGGACPQAANSSLLIAANHSLPSLAVVLSFSSVDRFSQVLPTAEERIGLLYSLSAVGEEKCVPLVAQFEEPISALLGSRDSPPSARWLHLHRLLHELPSFVDLVAAGSVSSQRALRVHYHLPPALVSDRRTLCLDPLLPLRRSDSSIPRSYELTVPALQLRHVHSAIASMAVGGRPAADQLQDGGWESSDGELLSLPCELEEEEEELCSNCTSSVQLLLSTHSLHITGRFALLAPGRFALQSLSVLSGPLQQAIDFRANGSADGPTVAVDGSPMRLTTVWPLLNYGNLTSWVGQQDERPWWTAQVQLAWADYADQPTFAYVLRLEGPYNTSAADGLLCESVSIRRAFRTDDAIGAFVDGWQQESERAVQPNDEKQKFAAYQLEFPGFALPEPALYVYPLVAFPNLPQITTSFWSLPPSYPHYLIPRVIHSNWFGPLIPPWLWLNSWRRDYLQAHPGWCHMLWHEASVVHLPHLDKKVWGVEVDRASYNGQSDASRVALVRTYGGLFLDADSASLDARPLDELWLAANSSGYFVARERVGSQFFAAGVFGAVPTHPILGYFQQVQREQTDRNPTQGEAERLGPGAATPAVLRCTDPCRFYEVQPVKFFPRFWLGLGHTNLTVNASLWPDALMYQFGFSSNGFDKAQESALSKGRRRRR